jgi:hypothetical protein
MRTLATVLLIVIAPLASAAVDTCIRLIPPALRTQLERRFTGYRLPHRADNLAENIRYAIDHSHSDCLGVSVGDFDGDGRSDYLVGLTARDGTGALIVAALTRPDGWEIYKLDEWPEGRARLYVAVEPPGSYDMVGDNDGPLEEGEVEKLVCPHAVAVFGTTEASGVAYCYSNSQWQHTWISD